MLHAAAPQWQNMQDTLASFTISQPPDSTCCCTLPGILHKTCHPVSGAPIHLLAAVGCQSEVCNFDSPGPIQQEVGWLHIPVHYSRLGHMVQVQQRTCNVCCK
jgi:hypothetical protein